MRLRHGGTLLLAATVLVGIAGCPSGNDIGTTLPVTGRVTIDDQPLAGGDITFHPWQEAWGAPKANKTKAGVSAIVKEGEYTVTSGTISANSKGAPPGWYKVTIAPGAAMTGTGTDPSKLADPKALTPASKAAAGIAEKYTKVELTPLEIEVKSGNNYDLKATSK
jgi:hypothetical protein